MDDVRIDGIVFRPRPMMPLDRAAVFATWLPSARQLLRETPQQLRAVAWETFQAEYPSFVESLLDSEHTVVMFRPEAPHVVHAWACAGRHALHWAYVPLELRGRGIGRAAITAALGDYPDRIHVTSPCEKRGRFVFNPFALRGVA